MGKENSKQYAALRQTQAFGSEAQARRGLMIDSERPGVTMAEMDAYYEGLLREIKEMENLINKWTPVEYTTLSPASRGIPRGKGDNHGKKSGKEINPSG